MTENFILERHLQRHSIFLGKAAYAVLGIYTPLDVMLPYVPMHVTATLLPFGDRIITDGNIESPSIAISFGSGARRVFREQYNEARATGNLVRSLPAPALKSDPAESAKPLRPVPTRRRSRLH